MAINAAIIAKYKKDTYRGIYLHWDGDPEAAGVTLVEHYSNPEKIKKLLAYGDLASLGRTVMECTYYERVGKPEYYFIDGNNFKEVVDETLQRHFTVEYIYCFDICDDKEWRFKEVLWDADDEPYIEEDADWVSVREHLSQYLSSTDEMNDREGEQK